MPVRRAKACTNCRRAKAGCSLSSPCSRCAKRHLECHYASALPRPENHWIGFRPIRPAGACSVNEAHNVSEHAGSLTSAGTAAASSSFDVFSKETEMTPVTAAGTDNQMPDLSVYSDFAQFFDLPESLDMFLENEPALHNSQIPGFKELTTPDSLNFASKTQVLRPQLSHRARSLQQGSLTGKMLLGRLTDYTRMMADAKNLPPFIHPPCSLGPNDECPPDSPHECLPETLAVCANLTKMFYSRISGSHGFIWQQICTHLRQMSEEVSS